MASRYPYAYYYDTQLPHMFGRLNPTQPPPTTLEQLVNDQQRNLWVIVCKILNKIESLRATKLKGIDGAILQYRLEMESWTQYFGQTSGPFPGVFPELISDPSFEYSDGPRRISGSSIASITNDSAPAVATALPDYQSNQDEDEDEDAYGVHTYVPITFEETPQAISPPTKQCTPPVEPQAQTQVHTEEEVAHVTQPSVHGLPKKPKSQQGHLANLPQRHTHKEIRAEIEKWNGKGYEPAYGWELDLPRYVIIVDKSQNAAENFGGNGACYFRKIKAAFPDFLIMWQRIRPGFMVIWIDALCLDHAEKLNSDTNFWEEFKGCYAFLKSWADDGNDNGYSMNVVEYLELWKAGKIEADKEELAMLSPPPYALLS